MKLYKDSYNKFWVANETCPSGMYSIIFSPNNLTCLIRNIRTQHVIYNGLVSELKTENETNYANRVDLENAVSDFFVNGINIEAQARIDGDTALQANIDAETQARIAADDILQANIDAINVVETNKLIPVTYEELKTLRDTSQLVPLQTYLLTDYRTTYQMSTDYQLDYNGNYYQTLEPMGGIVGEISNVQNQDGMVRTITLINGGSDYIDGSYTLDGGNYGCQYNIVAENGVITGVSLVDGGSLYYDGEYSIPGGNNDAIIQVSVGYKTYQVAGNTNPLEPLIVAAAGTNSLETICKSTIYGQDIIYYNIDDNSEGFTKGKIYRRIDTIQNNDIGTDWRHIKYRRWKLNVTNDWVNGQVYNRGDIVKNGTSIYMCYRTTELWNASLYNFIQLGFNNGDYAGMYTNYNNIYLGINIYDSFDDTYFSAAALSDDYRDTLMFTEYGSAIVNNKFETKYLHNSVFIGNNFYSNTVGNNFNSNTVGNNFYSNTVGNDFNLNIVGSYFNSNTVENNFNSNAIGNNFYFNTVGMSFNSNIIENDFQYNAVGNNFQSNTVGNDFYFNTIGNNFYSNTIGNNFNSNTIGNNFYFNTIGNYFQYNTVFENISNKDFLTIGELYTKTYNHKLTSTPNKVKIEWVDNYGDTNIERI